MTPLSVWLIVFSGLTALSTVVNTWIHWKTLQWRREDAPVRHDSDLL